MSRPESEGPVGSATPLADDTAGMLDEREADTEEPERDDGGNEPGGRASAGEKEGERDGEEVEVDLALVHAKRKAKTKAEREAARGGKAGNPGRFKGEMYDFLMQYVPAFCQIERRSKGSNRRLGDFWAAVRGEFWTKFTWQRAKEERGEEGKHWSQAETIESTNKVRTCF